MDPVRVLLIGCGGREYAIAQAIARSSTASELHCVGPYRNPELLRMSKSYAECPMDDVGLIVTFARQVKPALCIVGPEKPLAAGVVDALTKRGFPCIGPPQSLARLESDKGWCRDFLVKYGMADLCPAFRIFNGFDVDCEGAYCRIAKDNRLQRLKHWEEVAKSATEWMEQLKGNFVIKPLGLKGGKGVKVSGDHLPSIAEGLEYCHELFLENSGFVIEEKLIGEEFSLISLTDGRDVHHFPIATDFKRAYNGDEGPNTGGMGCIVRAHPHFQQEEIARKVTERVIESLAYEFGGARHAQILFGGFMVTNDGRLKVLEYNVRFGDPEAMGILAAQPVDLLRMMLAAASQRLGQVLPRLTIPPVSDCCVVYVVPSAYPDATNGTVKLQYQELVRRVLRNVKGVELIPAGLTINGTHIGVSGGNTRATPLWDWIENDSSSSTSPDTIAFTEDADDLLENNKAQITGSRTFAVVACGVENIRQLATVVFPRIAEELNGVFRWRTDIPAKVVASLRLPSPQQLERDPSASEEKQQPLKDRYKEAGVDIEAGNRAVASIQDLVQSTHTSAVHHVPGGFGGLVRSPNEGFLVSSTDSVGSKTELVRHVFAPEIGLPGLGQDIVNHCVNDVLVMGCMRPLWFLDYFATHTLDPEELRLFISGVSQACRNVGCSLIGGETAEIKDTYKPGGLDLVGCITGAMREDEMLKPRETLRDGDVVYALPSVSAHTNGFTLINKVYREMKDATTHEDIDWFRELAAPHKCYLEDIRAIQASGVEIKGLVHITGGGLVDNPPRVLSDNLAFHFNVGTIEERMPEMFRRLRVAARIEKDRDMYRTFNCGVGMLVVVNEKQTLEHPDAFQIGFISTRTDDGPVVFYHGDK